MRKILSIVLLMTLQLFARYDAYPSKACPAYNNMKHSQNSHHVILDPKRVYTVLDEHKGQKLVLVKGEQPAQRWVDGACFDKKGERREEEQTKAHSNTVAERDSLADSSSQQKAVQMLLALSWHNAFCETHHSRRECRRSWGARKSDNRFVLHGLWPQPISNIYCNVSHGVKQIDRNKQWSRLPKLALSEETRKELLQTMPGAASNLHRHEWFKHGSCSGKDPEAYFKEAIGLTKQVNDSKLGRFFAANTGKVVTLAQLRFKVEESFGRGSGKSVEMLCRRGLITELWFHLGGSGEDLMTLLKHGKKVRSRCQKGRIDRAGFR